MSLKGFHIFFIVLAALCMLGFAAWAFLASHERGGAGVIHSVGGFSATLSVVLAIYGVWFIRKKAKRLII